ncbi:tripartite tricarboxylate transporter TctB family protein [Cellulosimicrobium funkei]|nr:tripartite tricarboxylate transporter TctB family protein [Cellulosimicrobium funkei]
MNTTVATAARPGTPTAERPARTWAPSMRTAFYAVVLIILIGYTAMAFQMEWTTSGGRIGPGFFPRIIGSLGILVTVGALVTSIRRGRGDQEDEAFDEDELGEGDLGRHPVAALIAVAASAVLLVTLISLGAIVATAVFLFAMLTFLNRGRWVMNLVITVAVPLGMYLLFQTALNAGLPSGILPRF